MSKHFLTVAVVAIASYSSAFAEGRFSARLGTTNMDLTTVYSGGPADASYTSTNYGITYSMDNGFYVDYGAKSGSNDDSGGVGEGFSRDEVTYSIGRSMGNGYTVFGGYQLAEAELDFAAGSVLGGETIDIDGFFVGGGRSIPLNNGVLSLSAAYAFLDLEIGYYNVANKISGDGDGYSLAAVYTYPVNDMVYINAEYRQQVYNLTSTGEGGFGGALDQDDDLQVLGLNLVYNF